MKTYQVWTKRLPMELIEAPDSFTARKQFAAKHKVDVTDVMARMTGDGR